MLIAQLSDLHFAEGKLVHGRIDSAAALRAAVARINQLQPQPDLVVLTGDLVDRPDEATYAALAKVLRDLAMPFLLLPGNHDDRSLIRQAFPKQAFAPGPYLCCRYETPAGLVLTVDSTVPGQAGGDIADGQLSWLYDVTRARQPALLFMHHQPFPTRVAALDAIGLSNADRLAAWLRRKPQIQGVFAGHVHRPIFTICGGVLACTAPALVHQFAAGTRGDRLVYSLEPAGFLLIEWDGVAPSVEVVPLAMAPEIAPVRA